MTDAVGADRLVARSSSPLEGAPYWSGAFTSYVGIQAADLTTAVLGCWASVFGRDALERAKAAGEAATAVGMAVLVQRAVEPELGGVAEVEAGTVTVNVADGQLAGLLQGWVPGHLALVPAGRTPTGPAVELYGAAAIRTVAELASACVEHLGDDRLEWAIVDGSCYLLQCSRLGQGLMTGRANARRPGSQVPSTRRPSSKQPSRKTRGLTGEIATRTARSVARFGGAAGDVLVLPWHLAPHRRSSNRGPCGPLDTIEAVRSTSAFLAAEAWDAPPEEALELARTTLKCLRETLGPEPLDRLARLGRVDAYEGERLVRSVERLAAERIGKGEFFDPADAWRLGPCSLDVLISRGSASPAPAHPIRRQLDGTAVGPAPAPSAGPWEPFLREVVLANGTVHRGMGASDGVGAGRLLMLDRPRQLRGARERWVLHVPAPLPGYAPLLWGAAGLVSATGSSSAHLFEVARSLGVPGVAGADLRRDPVSGRTDIIIAVDGQGGEVVTL